jgi:hypothetical protein
MVSSFAIHIIYLVLVGRDRHIGRDSILFMFKSYEGGLLKYLFYKVNMYT